MLRKGSDFSEESVKKSWGKESTNERSSKFIPRFNSSFVEFVHLCFCLSNSEEFMNVFMRIGFSFAIKLVSFYESQVVTFNSKFVCGFKNSDCGTRRYLQANLHGTGNKKMDKNQSKIGQSQTREGKSAQEPGITICHENGIYQDLLNTYESSDDDTNVVNAHREPFVVKQDPGENSSQSPLQINHNCCYECGDSLDGIFCQRCTCKSCGKGAHIGYNCPPKALIISNPEPCNQTIDELPQTLPSFDPTCYSEKENSLPYVSKPNFVDDSPNVFNPPPQPPMYSCEFCGNDARYGHYCTPQVPFIYPKPCYNQDFNFPPSSSNFNAQNELLNSQNKIMEQMTSICDMVGQYMQNKEEDRQITEDQAAKDRYWKIPICYDDDEDYTIAITPVLSTEEPVDSLIMEDEHLDAIPATESDEVIKSSVENLVPIPSESEGIPDSVCDVPLCNNPTPLEAFKEHSEIVVDFNNDSTSSNDDSPYGEEIDYVDASPLDSELVSLEVVENVTSKDGEIEDDVLREKLSKINLLLAKIEALKDNPPLFSGFVTKSPSTFPNLFLEETNTFDNSLPESETFCFDLEENSSGSTTTRSDYSFLDYEAFYLDDDHVEEKSSGSTTTHADFSQYDSFIFRSICVLLPIGVTNKPELGKFTMDVVEDNFYNQTREPRVHVPNVLPTHPTFHLDSDFTLSSDSLGFDLVVSFPFGTRNKIFDPGIFIGVQSMIFLSSDEFSFLFIRDPPLPVIDTLLPFSSENENKVVNTGILASEEKSPPYSSHRGFKASKLSYHKSPMLIHGDNTPNLGVRHPHFYPPLQAQVWGDWVNLSDPKQALRGRHPMLILVILCRLSQIFEASRACGFVLRSQELQILSFIWEIQYPNLID
ncbi:hypothetical protein Tco_0377526 [Tanacetum coccineum]